MGGFFCLVRSGLKMPRPSSSGREVSAAATPKIGFLCLLKMDLISLENGQVDGRKLMQF